MSGGLFKQEELLLNNAKESAADKIFDAEKYQLLLMLEKTKYHF